MGNFFIAWFIYLSVCMCVCLSVRFCLFVCLSSRFQQRRFSRPFLLLLDFLGVHGLCRKAHMVWPLSVAVFFYGSSAGGGLTLSVSTVSRADRKKPDVYGH